MLFRNLTMLTRPRRFKSMSRKCKRASIDRPFPYPMSLSVPAMFANSTRYQRKLTMLPKGVAVTETPRARDGRRHSCPRT